MKYVAILMVLFSAFLTACETKTEKLVSDLPENPVAITTNTLPTPSQAVMQPKPKSKLGINAKIGVVDGNLEAICFRTKNGNLAENTLVSIITLYDSPQKVLNAKVGKKFNTSCAREYSESGDKNSGENFYYSLTLTDKEIDEYQEVFGFGIIEPENPIKVKNNLAYIDLNEDGKSEFFRICSGYEGMLLAIWTGEPLKGKQIWRSFYYVDYATEKDCKKKDN
jgi:hypothetical protein